MQPLSISQTFLLAGIQQFHHSVKPSDDGLMHEIVRHNLYQSMHVAIAYHFILPCLARVLELYPLNLAPLLVGMEGFLEVLVLGQEHDDVSCVCAFSSCACGVLLALVPALELVLGLGLVAVELVLVQVVTSVVRVLVLP